MRASERLTVAFLLLLSGLVVVAWPAGAWLRLPVFLAMAAITVALVRSGTHSPALRFLRDWFGLLVVISVYMLLQPVIEALTPWRLDAALAQFDGRYLGWLVSAWRGAFGRPDAFTDIVYAGYCSYYVLPVVVLAAVRLRGGRDGFEHAAFAVLSAFYLSYIGYLGAPASGPRLPLEQEASVVGGSAFSDLVRAFLARAEATTLDAFPSGHTAVALVSAVHGMRVLGFAGAIAVWLCAALVVFATVYIHVHYAVDVLAGIALAVLVLLMAPHAERLLAPTKRAANRLT